MTILEHSKIKKFSLNTYFKVKTKNLKFYGKTRPKYKEGFIFVGLFGEYFFNETGPTQKNNIFEINHSISNIEVIERIN